MGLFGFNGVGKIILFYMIVGFVVCDEGIIIIDDNDISILLMYSCLWMGIGYLL